HLLIVGDKGVRYLEDDGKSFDYLPGVSNEMKFAEAEKVADYAYGFSVKHNIGKIIVAYAKFHSFARQEIDTQVLLPCGYLFDKTTRPNDAVGQAASPVYPVGALTEPQRSPATYCGMRKNPTGQTMAPADRQTGKPADWQAPSITFEPFRDKVVDTLINMWWALKIYDIFWQSKLSELAARAMHLDGSMQELKEMKSAVQLQYFRGKHEIADRNIRDIFGGRRVLMKKEPYHENTK
ncbi:MAG: F0F1 ATP synthase subunit gamma, partial [Planctomycetes bacterium]|nr:F0F1 ATP synthase subunit gamma [Planctomycetota bacterium]